MDFVLSAPFHFTKSSHKSWQARGIYSFGLIETISKVSVSNWTISRWRNLFVICKETTGRKLLCSVFMCFKVTFLYQGDPLRRYSIIRATGFITVGGNWNCQLQSSEVPFPQPLTWRRHSAEYFVPSVGWVIPSLQYGKRNTKNWGHVLKVEWLLSRRWEIWILTFPPRCPLHVLLSHALEITVYTFPVRWRNSWASRPRGRIETRRCPSWLRGSGREGSEVSAERRLPRRDDPQLQGLFSGINANCR